jgi:hypothetical protein
MCRLCGPLAEFVNIFVVRSKRRTAQIGQHNVKAARGVDPRVRQMFRR